ncbi:MAG: metal-dependent hydrolase [Pseudomonadota bacterium]
MLKLWVSSKMMVSTHLATGNLFFFLVNSGMEYAVSPLTIGATALGSILPDIDTSRSLVGKTFYPVSKLLEKLSFVSHRGATHSIITISFVTIMLVLLGIDKKIVLCFTTGYLAHIYFDSFTPQGVKFLWPFSNKTFNFSVSSQKIITSRSKNEYVLLIFVIFLNVISYPIAKTGSRELVHKITGSIHGVKEDYKKYGFNNRSFIEIKKASHFLTQEKLSGRFKLIGDMPYSVIFEMNGQYYEYGKDYTADYLTGKSYYIKGQKIKTISHDIDMKERYLDDLKVLVDLKQEHYISGQLNTDIKDMIISYTSNFNTISQNGKILELKYAKVSDIDKYAASSVRVINGILSVKYIIADEASFKINDRQNYTYERINIIAHISRDSEVKVKIGDKLQKGDVLIKNDEKKISQLKNKESQLKINHQIDAANIINKLKAHENKLSENSLKINELKLKRSSLEKASIYYAELTKELLKLVEQNKDTRATLEQLKALQKNKDKLYALNLAQINKNIQQERDNLKICSPVSGEVTKMDYKAWIDQTRQLEVVIREEKCKK